MAAKDSMFGVQAPKFVDSEGNEVLLDYFVVLEDREDSGAIEHPSIINRHKEWVDRGEHWLFEGLIHLFKYPEPGEAEAEQLDAEEFYLLLQSYYKQNVILYRRRDGNHFVNTFLEPIYFRVDKLEPVFFSAKGYPDALLISFKSIEPVYGTMPVLDTFTENFTENTFNSDVFERAEYFVEDEELKLNGGICITCTTEQNLRYHYKYFRAKKSNAMNTSIIITADAKQGAWFKETLIGFYRDTKHFAGILLRSTGSGSDTEWFIRLQIANGDYPDYLLDINVPGYNSGDWNQYRVVWNSKEATVYFFIRPQMTGTWKLINNQGYKVPEFLGMQFKPGIQGRGSSSGTYPLGQLDNIIIKYNPVP